MKTDRYLQGMLVDKNGRVVPPTAHEPLTVGDVVERLKHLKRKFRSLSYHIDNSNHEAVFSKRHVHGNVNRAIADIHERLR